MREEACARFGILMAVETSDSQEYAWLYVFHGGLAAFIKCAKRNLWKSREYI